MAEAYMKSFDNNLEVFSAGTVPTDEVNPFAIRVMAEIGIDISNNKPKNVDEFLADAFDYVITVCDDAKQSCPMFIGKVKHRLHIGFPDPAEATGNEEEVLIFFRQVRDSIKDEFFKFYTKVIKPNL